MAFTSYATLDDLEEYAPGMADQFWAGDATDIDDALARASRRFNEWLGGLDRFKDSEIPVSAEDDGSYAEVIKELVVLMAVWAKVKGELAGEAFEDHWRWLPQSIRSKRTAIAKGEYRFGTDGDPASQSSPPIHLTRRSV